MSTMDQVWWEIQGCKVKTNLIVGFLRITTYSNCLKDLKIPLFPLWLFLFTTTSSNHRFRPNGDLMPHSKLSKVCRGSGSGSMQRELWLHAKGGIRSNVHTGKYLQVSIAVTVVHCHLQRHDFPFSKQMCKSSHYHFFLNSTSTPASTIITTLTSQQP